MEEMGLRTMSAVWWDMAYNQRHNRSQLCYWPSGWRRWEADNVGGLVGLMDPTAQSEASYATGNSDGDAGDDRVGGLVGSEHTAQS